MIRMRWSLVALLLSLSPAVQAEQTQDVHVDPPKDGAPWHHRDTDLSLPQDFGELHLEGGVIFKEPSFGESARFVDRRHGARVDVYVYPCRGPSKTAEERRAAAEDEIRQVMGGLKEMEKRGGYRKVSWDNGDLREITLGDDSKTFFIAAPARYEIKDQNSDPPTFTPVLSVAAVTIYRDHYVKLRYTLPADANKEALNARDAFVKTLRRCVLDASLRPSILKDVDAYRKDPLSEEARNVAGAITAFAEDSPLVNIAMGSGVMDFAGKCEAQVTGAQLDVVRAYITGATDAGLHDQGSAKVVEAAIGEVKGLCEKLKAKHPKFETPSLKEFESAIREDNKELLGARK
jgi:hypothetical protein